MQKVVVAPKGCLVWLPDHGRRLQVASVGTSPSTSSVKCRGSPPTTWGNVLEYKRASSGMKKQGCGEIYTYLNTQYKRTLALNAEVNLFIFTWYLKLKSDGKLVSKSENYAYFRYAGDSLQYSRKRPIFQASGQQICPDAPDAASSPSAISCSSLTFGPGLGLGAAVARVPSWLHLAPVDSVPYDRCFH